MLVFLYLVFFYLYPQSNINWSSPETLKISQEQVTVTQSADIWSIGMVLYEILSGIVPFDEEEYRNMTIERFLEELREGARPRLPKEFAHITWIKKMVREMT